MYIFFLRSNRTSISFKLRVYLIDQNTNIKTKRNVMFSVAWFLKLRLNDTFLCSSKKLETLILVIMMYRVYQKKSRKVKKNIMCALNKQRQNRIVIIFYHTYLYIKINLIKLMNLININNR